MAGIPKRQRGQGGTTKSSRGSEDPAYAQYFLIGIAFLFTFIFLVLPLVNVFYQAFSKGWTFYLHALGDEDSWAALKLTLLVSCISVPMNMVFGICAAWAVAKFDFPGKPLLITLIDLPFAISPVVAGLMLVILFGRSGYLGPWLEGHDWKVIFNTPGMVLATVFVTFPFVARELIPMMQATGSEQEQAALTLGASGWKTFWHVTLPSVKWGLIYGVILCNARAMGEFGAVSVVSGHISGLTETLPLRVETLYHGASMASGVAAFAVASILAVLALVTLVLKSWLEWKTERAYEAAQENHRDLPGSEADTLILSKSNL